MESITKEEYERRSDFLSELKNLGRGEKEEIFRILKRTDENFSENSNGIFFDLVSLKTNTFEKMVELLNFSKTKKHEQEERLKEMEKLREDVLPSDESE